MGTGEGVLTSVRWICGNWDGQKVLGRLSTPGERAMLLDAVNGMSELRSWGLGTQDVDVDGLFVCHSNNSLQVLLVMNGFLVS